MGTLNAALAWAQRGFPVFPLRENTREPALGGNWVDIATTDPERIRLLWTDPVLNVERDYNIGCLCTDMVVVDIDVKNGKDGYNQYLQLGGTFDTLVVRTTSGGFHCYFHGPDSSNAPIAEGVDIRSHNGYVVAPGSVIDGSPYSVIEDVDMSWVPSTIERMLKPAYVRSDVETVAKVDTEAAIQAGILFLQSTPVAIEGMRGDETTFITACRLVREMALSPVTAFNLMRDHWNPRCIPPWDLAELAQKVDNAAHYGSVDLGVLTPEMLFGHLSISPPPSVFESVTWGNAVMPTDIRPRPWLMDGMLMTGAVTMLLAPGSAGKSSVSLALAAHLALGKDFAGHKAQRACKTIVYNGEDDLEEQSRRLLAVCSLYGFDYDQVKRDIMLISPRQLKIDLVLKDSFRPMRNDVLVRQLTRLAQDNDVGLLVLDPLVKIHRCDESNNVDMDYVMETLTDIGHEASISILALHHTSKSSNKQEERIGNMDIARGASAMVNAARIAYTLLNASQQDAEDYGLQDNERNTWVRMDNAKMNMTLASDNAIWFKKEGVRIPSNDIVGVMKHESLEKSRHHIRVRIARILIDTMTGNNSGSMTMPQAISVVKQGEPLLANKTDSDLRKRIEGLFSTPVDIQGRVLHAVRDKDDPAKIKITLT